MIEISNYTNSKILLDASLNQVLNQIPEAYHNAVVIITDTNVFQFHGDQFPTVPVITIGLTEKIKTQATVDFIIEELLKIGVDRHWYLVGIGGGIVCDITGYVASIYMRGLRFGYVPTSLLAQVDASVGGKTGINFQGYKNMIGVFIQPDFVLCDFDVLKTLPIQEVKNGLIEAIKHGMISSPDLFDFIESNVEGILTLNPEDIQCIVGNSVRIKSTIVSEDEFEKGERKKLNLGHSYGHAIESLSGMSHGAAVAIGLVKAVKLSIEKGYCSSETLERLMALLVRLEMDTESAFPLERIVQYMEKDKKRNIDLIDFIFIQTIGRTFVKGIPFDQLLKI